MESLAGSYLHQIRLSDESNIFPVSPEPLTAPFCNAVHVPIIQFCSEMHSCVGTAELKLLEKLLSKLNWVHKSSIWKFAYMQKILTTMLRPYTTKKGDRLGRKTDLCR